MKLTERDIEIINFSVTGFTIQQAADMFFGGSYFTAAQRLIKLEKSKYIKSATNPTIGKKVYYKKKAPSYHSLVVNDIKIALRGKYSLLNTEYKLGSTRVDCIVVLKTKKLVIFEINIFNHTSQQRINYLNRLVSENGRSADIWILELRNRRRRYDGARIIEINKIKGLNTIYI